MTRDERLAAQKVQAKADLDAAQKRYDDKCAEERAEARKKRERWRAYVGRLAEKAGLMPYDYAELLELFELARRLMEHPERRAVLEALLAEDGVALEAVQE